MPRLRVRHAFVAAMMAVAMICQGTWALAGTTGGISGTLTDSTNGKPVAGAKIGAVSPSQSATTTTDAGGHFVFLNLAPDTYTLSADKDGYAPITQGGVTVFADQSVTVSLQTHPELKTIARVTSRAAGNLVKPGTTADVYSVNAATQQVVSSSGGGFNLNAAYSALYAQPGVTSYIGSAGWGQVFYIRGGNYSQTGYEFDGVPVNRAFDNYQANSLASLGQQELQVYTGGSPSSASSATLGGFINQVIKTGTYPGFGTLKGGIGEPGFYRGLTAEAGGSNPNRTFSYYVGLMGFNQHFPALTYDNGRGVDNTGLGQYGIMSGGEIATPIAALTGATVPGGINGTGPDGGGAIAFFLNGPIGPCQQSGPNAGLPFGSTVASPGSLNGACFGNFAYNSGLQDMYERDNVVNLHFALPHHNDAGRDDIQLLYDNSMQYQINGDSINDAGGLIYINNLLAPFGVYSTPGNPYPGLCGYENDYGIGCASGPSPIPIVDTHIFAPGTHFGQPVGPGAPGGASIVPYYFPNSPTNRIANTPFAPSIGIDPNLRDGFWNDVGIVKAQYTKNFSSNAYARLFGYTFYSDWLIGGTPSASTCYIDGFLCFGNTSGGGGPGFNGTADYELSTHTRGGELQFADQLNAQNLLRFTANYTYATVVRWNNNGTFLAGYLGSRFVTNLTNGDPNNPVCYSRIDGSIASCFGSASRGVMPTGLLTGTSADLTRGENWDPCTGPTPLPASSPACLAGAKWTVTTPSGQGYQNRVRPAFASASLEDELKPTDKLDLNISVRWENYRYNLEDVRNNNEFNYWFNAAAEVDCFDPGTQQPLTTPLAPGQPIPPNLVQTTPFGNCNDPTVGGAPSPSGQQALHPIGPFLAATPLGAKCVAMGQCSASSAQWFNVKTAPTSFTYNKWSPRLGGTYTLSPNDVLRFTVGLYTQPTETAFMQYLDQSGKRASVNDFSRFWGLGFHTPSRDNPVQYTNNYDFSWEHRFKNTDFTFKISPYYRDVRNQFVTIPLGPGFVSGINVGHAHSYGVEFQIQKGDPTRDGWSGALSYTYTKSQVQYWNLPNGTNYVDGVNNYIKAFNGLTSAGGGSPCYNAKIATPSNPFGGETCPATMSPTDIVNPYFNMPAQSLMDRNGYYPLYPNQPPLDPNDDGGGYPGPVAAIWPHQISAWVQYKRGKFAIAPNITANSGADYGDPLDTYGTDPRTCGQNEGAAKDASGAAIPVTPATAGLCDYLTASPTFATQSGFLAIPNPFTGHFDQEGSAFKEPWQANLGMLIRYDVSPKVSLNAHLANIYNWCFGGTSTPWQQAFKPSQWVCGYTTGNANYVGPISGQPGFGGGFFYGTTPTSPGNPTGPYPRAYNYPFAPYSSHLPFEAYLEAQIKL